MRGLPRAHACRCNKAVIEWLCACTGDNTLAKARGLSSRTYAQNTCFGEWIVLTVLEQPSHRVVVTVKRAGDIVKFHDIYCLHSVLFVGHRQTVLTQIVASDQSMHNLLTECSIKI